MIVTIDGPAGVGKSSAARELARRLGFEVLDTGAMYRAVAYAALRDGVNTGDESAVGEWLARLQLEIAAGQVRLNGEDVSLYIRTPEVTALASRVAVLATVRRFLVRLQRAAAVDRNLVCEGRDQGTVVFPNADRKFFLVANRLERARRRHQELVEHGAGIPLEEVLAGQDERDRRDAERDLAPMVPAADAIVIDSTHLTPEQVVEQMEREVRR
jgi:cytidylate kinase